MALSRLNGALGHQRRQLPRQRRSETTALKTTRFYYHAIKQATNRSRLPPSAQTRIEQQRTAVTVTSQHE